MKFLLLTLLIAITTHTLKAQRYIFHVSANNEYSVLIDQKTEISGKDIENGTLEYFVVNDSLSIFKYYFSVTKIQLYDSFNVYGNDYVNSFKKECQCEVVNFEKANYNNLSGLRISIKAEKDGRKLEGYSISSLTSNYNLYNITFLTRSKDLSIYRKNFNKFINSFVINDNN